MVFENFEIEVDGNAYTAEWTAKYLDFTPTNATALVTLTAAATAESGGSAAEIVLYSNNTFDITITPPSNFGDPTTISGTWTQANQVADIIATFPEGAGVAFGTTFDPITIEIDASGAATGGNIVYAAEWSYSIADPVEMTFTFSFEGELEI